MLRGSTGYRTSNSAAHEGWGFKGRTRGACRYVNTINYMDTSFWATLHSLSRSRISLPFVDFEDPISYWKEPPLDHILLRSQEPDTGPYPATFTRARHWTISCYVYKSPTLDHILLRSQEPVTGPRLQKSVTEPYPGAGRIQSIIPQST
jgi:hypothetical protein